MISKIALLLFQLVVIVAGDTGFNFPDSLSSSNLQCFEEASITDSGLIRLTNNRNRKQVGYAFYKEPFNVSNNNFSFSTTFIFAIVPMYPRESGDGLVFALSPTVDPRTMDVQGGKYLGMFRKNNGTSENVFGVEFDTFKNDGDDVKDINGNHVGVNINYIKSRNSTSASYFDRSGVSKPIWLRDGQRIQAWIEYDGEKKVVRVTILPLNDSKSSNTRYATKPTIPLLETGLDLRSYLPNEVYVGFSAATSKGKTSHYILQWSFALNDEAQKLDLSKLPKLPSDGSSQILVFMFFTVGTFVIFATIIAWVITLVVRRKTNEVDQVLEDWEVDYGPQRFSYIQLYKATDGFKRDNIIGTGGFGIVYRGVITVNGYTKEIAVKRIKRDIKDGLKDFVSEIVSISRLRHRNLIELLGYCRQRGELLLVYDFMPNGSLDRYLFGKENLMNWRQRFEIIKGVAAGLVYLHEEWAQVVVHRDIKSANVLLDRDLKSKLSDFGLARLYDHGGDSQTTSVVGTFGYLAPELTKTGKATTMTDVFAFGSMLLEVVSGRRPSDTTFDEAKGEYLLTMDWALECWKRGMLLQVVDEKLKEDYVEEEVYKVVQLAVLCSHNNPAMRLTIRQVMGILEGDVSLPPMSPIDLSSACMAVKQLDGFDGFSSRPISQTSQFEITSDIQSSPAEIDSTN